MSITSRIDAITGISQRYLGEVIPAPRSVKIELTANCNYKCQFCVKSIRVDNGEMDRGFYSRIIREMREAGVEELGVFYIGESFTCQWLPDAIREAKQVGYPYVFLTTNGSACTAKRLTDVFEAGLDSLKFSLNFSDEGQFQSIAKVNPKFFRKAIENIKIARKIRDEDGYPCKLYASSIAFDGSQGELMKAIVDEVSPYVDEHYWLPLYGMSGASKAHGWTPKAGNPGRLDAMREPLPCWAVFTEGHITREGHLAACCFGSGIGGDLLMGDLNTTPFMEAWNSKAFQELRQAHLAKDVSNTACGGCAAGS
jgi:Iron-sulfur cluster-binding domain/Radical SAM superfamily